MNSVDKIKVWTSERSSFYFFLPDGPYGRPFDNQYTIQKIESSNSAIEIQFNEGFTLRFIGVPDVLQEECNLLISGYLSFHFEGPEGLLKLFDYGEVTLTGF